MFLGCLLCIANRKKEQKKEKENIMTILNNRGFKTFPLSGNSQ